MRVYASHVAERHWPIFDLVLKDCESRKLRQYRAWNPPIKAAQRESIDGARVDGSGCGAHCRRVATGTIGSSPPGDISVDTMLIMSDDDNYIVKLTQREG